MSREAKKEKRKYWTRTGRPLNSWPAVLLPVIHSVEFFIGPSVGFSRKRGERNIRNATRERRGEGKESAALSATTIVSTSLPWSTKSMGPPGPRTPCARLGLTVIPIIIRHGNSGTRGSDAAERGVAGARGATDRPPWQGFLVSLASSSLFFVLFLSFFSVLFPRFNRTAVIVNRSFLLLHVQ